MTLWLQIDSAANEARVQRHALWEARITALYLPITMSPVMEVLLHPNTGLARAVILKLYDHRASYQMRKDWRIPAWTAARGLAYEKFVLTKDAKEFWSMLASGDTKDEDEEQEEFEPKEGTTAEQEAFLHDLCRKFQSSETSVYGALKDIQGTVIPKFFASVQLQQPGSTGPFLISDETSQSLSISGVLLEKVEGFSIGDWEDFHKVTGKVPRDSWQAICEDMIWITNMISDRGILNKDVRPANFMLREIPSFPGYEVLMIDFAQCCLRDPNQSWEDWRTNQRNTDEEGAVGVVMQDRLDGVLKYTRTLRCGGELEDESIGYPGLTQAPHSPKLAAALEQMAAGGILTTEIERLWRVLSDRARLWRAALSDDLVYWIC